MDEWRAAFAEWIDPPEGANPNPVPLADLLRSDKPIPRLIRSAIAEAINPVSPVRANWSVRTVWSGAFNTLRWRSLRDSGIWLSLVSAPRGAVDKSAESLGEKYGISDRQVYKISSNWKKTWKEFWGMPPPPKPKSKPDKPEC